MPDITTPENEGKSSGPIETRELPNLVDLMLVIWASRLQLAFAGLLGILISTLYALSIEDLYSSEIILAPKESGGAAGLSQLASRYGGIASLAGIELGGAGGQISKADIAVERIRTHGFFADALYEEMLLDLLAAASWDASAGRIKYDGDVFDEGTKTWVRKAKPGRSSKPSSQEAFEIYLKHVNVSKDRRTSFVTVKVDHLSPVVAAAWARLIVKSVDVASKKADVAEANEAIKFLLEQQESTQFFALKAVFAQLIEEQLKIVMLANASDNYVLQIIDPPVASEQPFYPRRGLYILFATVTALILAAVWIILRYYIDQYISRSRPTRTI